MYYHDYAKEISEVHSKLKEIAERSSDGLLDLAGLSDDYFSQLYEEHTQIAKLSLDLADRLVKQGAKKR